jgi:hypothetical protein
VFEDRMLKRMLGPKRESIVGFGRKLHDEELHKF